MRIPNPDNVLVKIYRCGHCNGLFNTPKPPTISCCVAHAPGTCCHYAEVPVKEEVLDRVMMDLA